MKIDTNTMVAISDANANFSKVAKLADENGSVVILKNNVPRYLLVEFSQLEKVSESSDEDVIKASRRFLEKNAEAYEVLSR